MTFVQFIHSVRQIFSAVWAAVMQTSMVYVSRSLDLLTNSLSPSSTIYSSQNSICRSTQRTCSFNLRCPLTSFCMPCAEQPSGLVNEHANISPTNRWDFTFARSVSSTAWSSVSRVVQAHMFLLIIVISISDEQLFVGSIWSMSKLPEAPLFNIFLILFWSARIRL